MRPGLTNVAVDSFAADSIGPFFIINRSTTMVSSFEHNGTAQLHWERANLSIKRNLQKHWIPVILLSLIDRKYFGKNAKSNSHTHINILNDARRHHKSLSVCTSYSWHIFMFMYIYVWLINTIRKHDNIDRDPIFRTYFEAKQNRHPPSSLS